MSPTLQIVSLVAQSATVMVAVISAILTIRMLLNEVKDLRETVSALRLTVQHLSVVVAILQDRAGLSVNGEVRSS